MAKIDIELYNLHYTVKLNDKRYNYILEYVNTRLTTYSYEYSRRLRRLIRKPDKTYLTYDINQDTYRLPIKTIKNFMLTLGNYGIKKEDIKITDRSNEVNGDKLNLRWNKNNKLRDYQERYVNAVLENLSRKILLIDLHTGAGKSIIASYIIYKLNLRTGILILPKYIEKWIEDVKKYTNVTNEDIYVVKGGETLLELMNKEVINYKFIIFSLRTISNYISDYETGNNQYPITPQNLFKKLKIGVLFNDETHQHFHALNNAMLYFDADLMLGSSATFDSNKNDIKRMYNTVIPRDNRVSGLVAYNAYVNVKAVRYRLELVKRIKYKRPQGYSHYLFEKSLLAHSLILKNYLEMINYYVKESYIDRKEKGDKLLIFCASISLCTKLSEYLSELYPDLRVNRYVEDDEYENVITGDIIVSTVLSAGTAFDIPNLITVLQTVSIASSQANQQSFGRLRNLPGKEMWFYCLYTRDIESQVRMNKERYESLKDKIKCYYDDEYFKTINWR